MPGPIIEEILQQEYAQLELSRSLRLGDDIPRPPVADSPIGLSFSGGGIRSATFNLGILQALAKGRMLRAFDYLSSVSGGGYISSWLMAWMHHQKIGIKKIEELLADQPVAPRLERPEVRFLRSYSNYLTPRKGLLGADFWAFVGSYLRNMLLNQTILILSLLSLLLIPRCILFVLHFFEILEQDSAGYHGMLESFKYSQYFALLAGLISGAIAVIFMGLNLGALAPGKNAEYRWYTYQQFIQFLIVIPLFFSAAMFSYGRECSWSVTKSLPIPLGWRCSAPPCIPLCGRPH